MSMDGFLFQALLKMLITRRDFPTNLVSHLEIKTSEAASFELQMYAAVIIPPTRA